MGISQILKLMAVMASEAATAFVGKYGEEVFLSTVDPEWAGLTFLAHNGFLSIPEGTELKYINTREISGVIHARASREDGSVVAIPASYFVRNMAIVTEMFKDDSGELDEQRFAEHMTKFLGLMVAHIESDVEPEDEVIAEQPFKAPANQHTPSTLGSGVIPAGDCEMNEVLNGLQQYIKQSQAESGQVDVGGLLGALLSNTKH